MRRATCHVAELQQICDLLTERPVRGQKCFWEVIDWHSSIMRAVGQGAAATLIWLSSCYMERLSLRFKGDLGLPSLSAMRGLFSRALVLIHEHVTSNHCHHHVMLPSEFSVEHHVQRQQAGRGGAVLLRSLSAILQKMVKARKRLRMNVVQRRHGNAVTAAVAHFVLRVTELKASFEDRCFDRTSLLN